MQPPSSFSTSTSTSTPSLPYRHPTSMETNEALSTRSLSYSSRCVSFGSESFIEFDPKLFSMRWSNKALEEGASGSCLEFESILLHSISLESSKSLPSVGEPVALNSAQSMNNDTVPKQKNFRPAFQNYFWVVLMKICKMMRRMKMGGKNANKISAGGGSVESGRGNRVSDIDTESSVDDAVLHCKISNLSSLMEQEYKAVEGLEI